MQVRSWIFLKGRLMFIGFSVHSIRGQRHKKLCASLYNWVRNLDDRSFTNRDIIFHIISYYYLGFTSRPQSPLPPLLPSPSSTLTLSLPPQSTLLLFLLGRGQLSLEDQQNMACFSLGKDSWYLQAVACVLAYSLWICVFVTAKCW